MYGERTILKLTIGMLAVLLWTGCSSFGPSTVNRDRFDYITAISDSWKRQTLLNIIKMRNADALVFLEVGQVISGYEVEGSISAGGTIGNNTHLVPRLFHRSWAFEAA